MFRRVIEYLDGANGVTLSAHCHDDLGLGEDRQFPGRGAGGRAPTGNVRINGYGERAGNAAARGELTNTWRRAAKSTLGVNTNVHLDQLFAANGLLVEVTGAPLAPNKAIAGADAFAHEAGIHQDGILKNPLTYEIISPEAVGVPKRSMVLGKHSGRNALRATLVDLGFQPTREDLDECYKRVVTLADASENVSNRDLLAIAHQVMRKRRERAPVGAE